MEEMALQHRPPRMKKVALQHPLCQGSVLFAPFFRRLSGLCRAQAKEMALQHLFPAKEMSLQRLSRVKEMALQHPSRRSLLGREEVALQPTGLAKQGLSTLQLRTHTRGVLQLRQASLASSRG